MIVALKGRLASSSPFLAVVDAGGVFYGVNIPLTTAEKLPRVGEEVFLHTLAIYREDSQSLYGFASAEDRDFFRVLVEKVSGIGPKTALNMMSRMSVGTLESAISAGDVAMLSKCPGIGSKTAQRLVVELRGAISKGGAGFLAVSNGVEKDSAKDAIAALVELGYKLSDADKAVRKVLPLLGDNPSTEEILKRALSDK